MSEPFIFITSHTISEDKLDAFAEMSRKYVQFVEDNEPRMTGLHVYSNDDGTEVSLVQIHEDPDSMEFHLHVVAGILREALQLVVTDGVQVYGTPGARTRQLLEQIAASGVPVNVREHRVGGFARAVSV